ncbi:MAG: hypothetical protein ABIG30_01550 [Candidatus Aenigmatarchaeota archaeon]
MNGELQLIKDLADRGYHTMILSNSGGKKPGLHVDFMLSSLPDVDDAVFGFNKGVNGNPILVYFENVAALRDLPSYCKNPKFLDRAGAPESSPRAFFIDSTGPSARLS